MINLSPVAPLEKDILERFWTRKDVSYSHLRVFGCKAFVHVPKDQRTKLDDKTISCFFFWVMVVINLSIDCEILKIRKSLEVGMLSFVKIKFLLILEKIKGHKMLTSFQIQSYTFSFAI